MLKIGDAELFDAFRGGRTLDCARGGARGVVEASSIRHRCIDWRDKVDPHGISLRSASILGSLDLAGLNVPFPLRFDNCNFEAPPIFEGAQLHELALTACGHLPGVLANGIRVHRDLDLSRSTVTGGLRTSASTSKRSAIWLCESEIGGRLLCVDTAILADGERSIQADRMHVAGTVRFLHQFIAVGEVRLLGARIGGSLDLTGAHIDCARGAAGPALDLGDAVIDGSLFLIIDSMGRRPLIRGRLDMGSACISGQLLIRSATIEKSSGTPLDSGYSRSRLRGTAVSAPRLSVGAEVTMEGSCETIGGIDFSMSDMSSLSIHAGCSLRADGATALDLTNVEIRSGLSFDSGVEVRGTIRLPGAHIRGDLTLKGAALTEPERTSPTELEPDATGHVDSGQDGDHADGYGLIADRVQVGGSVFLNNGFVSAGAIRLLGAEIAGQLDCTGARLNGRDESGYSLLGDEIKVGGSVLLNGDFVSRGAVRLPGANIARALACGGAHIDGRDKQGVALITGGTNIGSMYLDRGLMAAGTIWMRSAHVRGSVYLAPARPVTGLTGIDAAHAQVDGTLSWIPTEPVEGRVSLEGMTAGRLIDDWSSGRDNAFWPSSGKLRLDGFTYGRIGGDRSATVEQRLAWIRSQYHRPIANNRSVGFTTQPYEQLAAVYRHAGQETEARRVAITRRSDLREFGDLALHRRTGDWLLEKSIKYGYETWRAAASLAVLFAIVLVCSIFAQHHGLIRPVGDINGLRPVPTATACTSNYSCFYPAGYALDTVVPIINVHQADHWGLDGNAPWGWAWVASDWLATGLGWALATLLVAGYTGLARRQ